MGNYELYHPKNYICVGNSKIKAEWLPRWYGVPYKECVFRSHANEPIYNKTNLIVLTPLGTTNNKDYKQKLKELKTERLLDGTDIR